MATKYRLPEGRLEAWATGFLRWIVLSGFWLTLFAEFLALHPFIVGIGSAFMGFVLLIAFDSWRARRDQEEMRRQYRNKHDPDFL